MMLNKFKENGGALIIVMIMTIILLGVSGAMVIVATQQSRAVEQASINEQCFAILQAGIANSVLELNKQTDPDNQTQGITSEDFEAIDLDSGNDGIHDWTPFAGGFYQISSEKLGTLGRYRLTARAIYNGTVKSAEVIVQAKIGNVTKVTVTKEVTVINKTLAGGPFVNAFFQGNNGNQQGNELLLAGAGVNADAVNAFPPSDNFLGNYPEFSKILAAENNPEFKDDADPKTGLVPGNVYSTAPVTITEEAFISPGSEIRSGGDISVDSSTIPKDESGNPKVTQNPDKSVNNPELPDYDNLADAIPVNISDFTSNRTANFGEGGNTPQDPNDPRHIFLANPTKKHSGEIANTTRNDFFLHDPYKVNSSGQIVVGDASTNKGEDKENNYDGPGFSVSLSPQGNNKVYVIDGNMWIHSLATFTFKFDTIGDGTRATFVAKGNIFIGDNVTYQNLEKDAVAFIAIKDSRDEPDEFGNPNPNKTKEGSGNIQFGDPQAGTTFRFTGFMFAENDFLADNVSNSLFVFGNMTAGNEVKITRGEGTNRKALIIDYDGRIQLGLENPDHPLAITLPGLPKTPIEETIVIEEEQEQTIENESTTVAFSESTYEVVGITEIATQKSFLEDPNNPDSNIRSDVPALPDALLNGAKIKGLPTKLYQ